MRKRPDLFVLLLSILAISNGKAQPISTSRIDRSYHGVPTLISGGKPFIIAGAQCDIWRSTRQDKVTEAFFTGYRDMNATTVSVGIPWSRIEADENRYDFEFIDWFVQRAESNGLKLILSLFNSNVCGKIAEGAGATAYPRYTPTYIADHPEKYQRMVLPYPYRYVDGGPPMCPNDPGTLERERKLAVKICEHLKLADVHKTVIMLQLDNEFYYQQWDGKRPDYGSAEEIAVRCQCDRCKDLFANGKYSSGEEFMFKSFARYVKTITDAMTSSYPLPIYLNSPWWPPRIIPIFLDACPNIQMVGIDGVLSPREPAIFSESQLSRNLPFAAENPTENAEVRLNLDVLPYYTLLGRPGVGNLLWECGAPHTVVDDPAARKRYGDALYPIKNAMLPIAMARGTDRLHGWFEIRDIASDLKTDAFGNYLPKPDGSAIVSHQSLFVREGGSSRNNDGDAFETSLGGLTLQVSGSPAGVLVALGNGKLIAATARGTILIRSGGKFTAEAGRFSGEKWITERPMPLQITKEGQALVITSPVVLRLTKVK